MEVSKKVLVVTDRSSSFPQMAAVPLRVPPGQRQLGGHQHGHALVSVPLSPFDIVYLPPFFG